MLCPAISRNTSALGKATLLPTWGSRRWEGTNVSPLPFLRRTPSTRMLIRYLRYCSRKSSGIGLSSRTARMLNSSPEPNDSLPSEEKDAMRPNTASSGVSSWTMRNCPCIGMFWNSFRYGKTRSAWNSMPPCWKPRKIPTTCSLGKSWISAMLFSLIRTDAAQDRRPAAETHPMCPRRRRDSNAHPRR